LKAVNQKPIQAGLTLQPPTLVLIWFSHWLPHIAILKSQSVRAAPFNRWIGPQRARRLMQPMRLYSRLNTINEQFL
jgi:hypothetical protein